MTNEDILEQRLQRQHFTRQPNKTAAEVVASLVAVQSQEYAGAKWALGLRLSEATDESIDAAFNAGEILRTHVLRPTWHFVAPQDIRSLLQLTAPHIHALSDYYYRQKQLDKKVFAQCHTIIEKALRDNNYLIREELKEEFDKKGITTDTLRLAYIMMQAELEGLICSGPRKGKQFTYALMDERVPAFKPLQREEILEQVTRRYFEGHGPATMHDMAKWSGLKIGDVKEGIGLAGSSLQSEIVGKNEFWFTSSTVAEKSTTTNVWMLPTYDEYVIGYKVNEVFMDLAKPPGSLTFDSTVMINGVLKGCWRRTINKKTAVFEVKMFTKPEKVIQKQIEAACEKYAIFFGVKSEVFFV